jgi:hypothetical protein
MKKIFDTFIFFCAILVSAAVFACSQEPVITRGGIVTGGACSINELNLEKNESVMKKADFLPSEENSLRSIKNQSTKPLSNDDGCLFGRCLYKQVIEIESR